MPFEFFNDKTLPEVVIAQPSIFSDVRGFFMESFKQSDFAKAGVALPFVQDNHSRSVQGTVRGLHYQLPPHAQGKLVRCVKGSIFDVAVDIRKSSPRFGKWTSVTLTEENRLMIYIPPGFAHGFYTLSEQAEIIYKATAEYSKESDRGILWDDASINIVWPDGPKLLSDRDLKHPHLSQAEVFA